MRHQYMVIVMIGDRGVGQTSAGEGEQKINKNRYKIINTISKRNCCHGWGLGGIGQTSAGEAEGGGEGYVRVAKSCLANGQQIILISHNKLA